MIVDTSAIMAILLDEPERPSFVAMLAQTTLPRISAGSWIELAAVQGRGNRDFRHALERLVTEFGLRVEPVSTEQARIGAEAYRTYGQGSGHRARLNFGDCFAYALARESAEPLLFKGDDFGHTDVRAA
ncbi:type II toxin-antitoxin system VapC family toxin [Sphingomonas sp.]|uniref:type II toxin-antitoxin system VapC family toxin n=1 Tax=Sphingomonas sp. TaxID=28214 RepID=UPI001B2821F2|nr:type II toxin-antitoxin system VapC family toxin [Sphingomonas sp.]MBO9714925.1 type II toxin-antitoxin system VapC family toxin [Sphingomonas sp.]